MYNTLYELLKDLHKDVFGGDSYLAPDIPEKKMNGAITGITDGQVTPEEVVMVVDTTLFGSSTDGMVFTNSEIFIKNITGTDGNYRFKYSEIDDAVYDYDEDIDDKGNSKIKNKHVTVYTTQDDIFTVSTVRFDKEKFAELFKALAESSKNFDESTPAKIEIKPLEEQSGAVRKSYLKIMINFFLANDNEIDANEYNQLYIMMSRLNLEQKDRFEVLQSVKSHENDDALLKTIFDDIDIALHENMKISLIKDLIYAARKCYGDNSGTSEYIKNLIEKFKIEDAQVEFIIKAIDNDEKLFDESVDDTGLQSGIRELSSGAASVGVPLAALYFSGSVIGLSATGITSGLAALGFGGILGFSSMATGLGALLLLGYGAKKGVDILTGQDELDKRERKEALLMEVNKQMLKSINIIRLDQNYLIERLEDTIQQNNSLENRLAYEQNLSKEKIQELVLKLKDAISQRDAYMKKIKALIAVGEACTRQADTTEMLAQKQSLPYNLDVEKLKMVTEEPTKKPYYDLVISKYHEIDGKYVRREDLTPKEVNELMNYIGRIGYFSATNALKAAGKSLFNSIFN